MTKGFQTFLLSLLIPGLGYLQTGNRKSFYKTIIFFLGVIIIGVTFKFFISFWGLSIIIISLTGIYFFAAVNSALTIRKSNSKIQTSLILKFCFIISFILIIGLAFANRRAFMGFDVMNMNVGVMQPTVLQDERFLVDTWAYKSNLPTRGDIIAHTFNGQKGIY